MSTPSPERLRGVTSTDGHGNRLCTWEDSAEVSCAIHKTNKRGQYPVTVCYKGEVVGNGTVNLLDLADRKRMYAHCRALDGAVNWIERFLEVAQDLSVQDGTAPTQSANPWEAACTAQAFLQQADENLAADVKDLIVPGCITMVSAPRASGKSLVALYLGVALAQGGVFRGEQLSPKRVLLVDRDNPPSLVRKRLRWLGAAAVTGLKLVTREQAPPLSDRQAWSSFPVADYDVVLIDSVGAATEGISEKEGKQTQEFLATLKDLAHRGPAVLGLDNTNKAATSYRGRGEKADAVDILYECRNVTGWTPDQPGAWWECLPEYGEHTWQQRASRHKGQTVLRVAFIPSKFRLGIEPEPFILEIDTRQEPWTLADITAALATAGARAAEDVRHQERAKLRAAARVLAEAVGARGPESPMHKDEAVRLLCGQGLSRSQARKALDDGFNADVHPEDGLWRLRAIPGTKGHAIGVYPVGGERSGGNNPVGDTPRQHTPCEASISATGSTPAGENMQPIQTSDDAISETDDFRHSPASGWQKSEPSIITNSTGENGVPFISATHDAPTTPDALPAEVAAPAASNGTPVHPLQRPPQRYVIARRGEVGKRYRPDAHAPYHAIEVDPSHPTVEAINNFHAGLVVSHGQAVGERPGGEGEFKMDFLLQRTRHDGQRFKAYESPERAM